MSNRCVLGMPFGGLDCAHDNFACVDADANLDRRPATLAHEDHSQRALYAALRMLEELRSYAAALRERGRAPIEIRVGVNTGEVVVRAIQTAEGHAEYTPIGHATNLASRMQTVAATGTIAATENTRKLCEGYFTFRALGPTRIKGVSEAVNVHEVTGLGALRTRLQASARRGLSKFVGREAELTQLKNALASAKSGRGQIVAAVAEAGVGKSRLFYEFQAIRDSEAQVLETLAVPHGKASPYLPLIDLLKDYFGITAEDDVRKRRERIAALRHLEQREDVGQRVLQRAIEGQDFSTDLFAALARVVVGSDTEIVL